MTASYEDEIPSPPAWTSAAIGGKQGLIYQLDPAHLAAIDAVLAHTRHLAPQQVTRADFDHPALNAVLADVFEILAEGRGAVVIRGVTPDRYDAEAFERIYWGFGTHWGEGVVQSALGDRLGRVTFTPVGPDNPTGRAYRSQSELSMHTDSNEIVGLMCVQSAASGGYSQLASSLAIHNEVRRRRPDLLEPLYRGYFYSSREQATTNHPVTPYRIPVFARMGDTVSCQYVREFMLRAAEKLGEPFPPDLHEALDLVDAIAHEPDMKAVFMLDPGEMMVFNNFTVLHSRTEFQDSLTQRRLLLRLWLNVPNGRAVPWEFIRHAETYRGGANVSRPVA